MSRDDNNGDIDDDILYDYVPYNHATGLETAIIAMENNIKNSYDIINYLQKKLPDSKNHDEYNKIIDNIDQLKKYIPKKEKELYYFKAGLIKTKETNKKEPTKRIRTDEARPLYSLERRKADLDTEKMLLDVDNDKISNLSKKFKNKLSNDEYIKIIDDINKIDKKRKERIEKIKKIKENMELFYPPEQRIANFEEKIKVKRGI